MEDKDGREHSLFYYLYNTPLLKKWVELVNKNLDNPKHKIYSDLNNTPYYEFYDLSYTIIDTIWWLIDHGYGPDGLPQWGDMEEMTQEKLNYVHELFEKWGEIRDNTKDPTGAIADNWFRLNELIHRCENALQAYENHTYLQMCGTIDIHPLGLHNELTDQDKLLLTTQFEWGGLYLGYNTQGKDYLTVAQSNDIRAIDNNQVKPQKRYAAEGFQYFGRDCPPIQESQMFSSWYETLPSDTKHKIPLTDLTLGRVILGKLIPHMTKSCMDITKNISNWEISNHSCKDEWNEKYYSKFIKTNKIKFHQLVPNKVKDFIKRNRKYMWRPDFGNVPSDVSQSDWPWLPIDPFFGNKITNVRNGEPCYWDQRRIEEELWKVNHLFVPHRAKDKISSYGHQGWSALTIHGIDTDKTENYDQYGFKSEEEANYKWLPQPLKQCPSICDFVKSIGFKKLSRVRIMKLAPGGYIMPHNDTPDGGKYKRVFGPINIALTQPVDCFFVMEGVGLLPFRPGKGFILDVGHNHCLLNASNQNRYHLIIHGEYDEHTIKKIL